MRLRVKESFDNLTWTRGIKGQILSSGRLPPPTGKGTLRTLAVSADAITLPDVTNANDAFSKRVNFLPRGLGKKRGEIDRKYILLTLTLNNHHQEVNNEINYRT